MNPSLSEVKRYYDEHTVNKLKGFVYSNERVERAWHTIVEYGGDPLRILEIGCGIGDICWRMSEIWKNAEVIGLDISAKSIEIATKLFASPRLQYIEGILDKGKLSGKFDLVVLMDVYEHIAVCERPLLHEAIKGLLSERGKVILSFPTPRHLAWLRIHDMSNIQPIDEDVDIETISRLAKDIDKEVVLYKEVNVWYEGDYAHAVLGSRIGWKPGSDRIKEVPLPTLKQQVKSKIIQKIKGRLYHTVSPVEEKLNMISEKLGDSWMVELKNH